MFRVLPLIGCLATTTTNSRAPQLRTEVVELGRISSNEILPVTQPLVTPSELVCGLYTILIVNAAPQTLEDLLLFIQTLDHAPRATTARRTTEKLSTARGLTIPRVEVLPFGRRSGLTSYPNARIRVRTQSLPGAGGASSTMNGPQ